MRVKYSVMYGALTADVKRISHRLFVSAEEGPGPLKVSLPDPRSFSVCPRTVAARFSYICRFKKNINVAFCTNDWRFITPCFFFLNVSQKDTQRPFLLIHRQRVTLLV